MIHRSLRAVAAVNRSSQLATRNTQLFSVSAPPSFSFSGCVLFAGPTPAIAANPSVAFWPATFPFPFACGTPACGLSDGKWIGFLLWFIDASSPLNLMENIFLFTQLITSRHIHFYTFWLCVNEAMSCNRFYENQTLFMNRGIIRNYIFFEILVDEENFDDFDTGPANISHRCYFSRATPPLPPRCLRLAHSFEPDRDLVLDCDRFARVLLRSPHLSSGGSSGSVFEHP